MAKASKLKSGDTITLQEDGHKVILFDGICNLCSGFVQFVINNEEHDALKFASLQSSFALQMLNRVPEHLNQTDSIVYIDGEKIYCKGDAVLQILSHLRYPWKLGTCLGWIPTVFRNTLYDALAKRRYIFFGKKEECWLPSPELAAKFID